MQIPAMQITAMPEGTCMRRTDSISSHVLFEHESIFRKEHAPVPMEPNSKLSMPEGHWVAKNNFPSLTAVSRLERGAISQGQG